MVEVNVHVNWLFFFKTCLFAERREAGVLHQNQCFTEVLIFIFFLKKGCLFLLYIVQMKYRYI